MKKKSKLIGFLLAIAVILGGGAYWVFSQNKQNSHQNPKQHNQTVETEINPLTGLPIDESKANNRPIAIMINNYHGAQPLHGVSEADIMFECPAEGGITRILSVFKDYEKVSTIGSVRSSRPYFIDLAKSLDAIYVHLGGSTHAYEKLNSGYIDSIDLISLGQFMWRDAARRSKLGLEHSAMTSGEKLVEAVKFKGYKTQIDPKFKNTLNFGEKSQVLDGQDVKEVSAIFSDYKRTTFTYDAQKQTYLISQFKGPQIDGNINEQNSKQNIIFLDVRGQKIDNSKLLSLSTTGEGTGKYFSRGKCIDIKWSRNEGTNSFKFFTADNKDLLMLPGKIYICVLPQWSSIEIK